ncbi:MAG: protein-L-isoaspartate O-methyltransferase [bacterium]|nr:protein-L-isoaspartate O-methyltransferase [bacterium]
MNLIDSLIADGWLKTPAIINAFRVINRADFLSAEALTQIGLSEKIEDAAEANEALPIGFDQTISQPLVVAFMLELLQPEPGQKILDIGCGSGYTTALLANIISQKKSPITNNQSPIDQNGKVIGIEIVPELVKFAEKNTSKYNFVEKGIAEIIHTDGSKGYPAEEPFDRILASASAQNKIPEAWKHQLKIGGRIVCPIKNSIWLFIKKSEDNFEMTEFPGFVFVPLI